MLLQVIKIEKDDFEYTFSVFVLRFNIFSLLKAETSGIFLFLIHDSRYFDEEVRASGTTRNVFLNARNWS